MNDDSRDAIDVLAAALDQLDLRLDDQQRSRLLAYLALLQRWRRVYNLTAFREAGEMVRHHLLDSLAIVRPLRRVISMRTLKRSVLDVGSGAGLPGIILAIAAPELTVTCVDAVGKKAGFMRQAVAELGLPSIDVLHARVEDLSPKPWSLIVARAFSALADFTALTEPLLDAGGVWLAMKGKPPQDEMQALPRGIGVFHVEPLRVPGLDAERCLVWLERRPSAD